MIATFLLVSTIITDAADSPYAFSGSMPESVLRKYLGRSVTHAGLLASSADPTTETLDDDIRMLTRIGAKFVGRSAFAWDLPNDDNRHFAKVRQSAAKVHAADPEIILQAAVFEVVTNHVRFINVPPWVFEAFGKPMEKRNFNYGAMLFDNGKFHNHWRGGSSVPDMSKLETRMWFYYRARRYIDCGIEAIHFGQVKLMDDADPGHKHWVDMLTMVRDYAKEKARRKFVLCDAHTHGEVVDGKLLFDFHSYPMRIREVKGKPMQAFLAHDRHGDIVKRSKGGLTPSGWSCKSAPYLIEFDNYGYSGSGGKSVGGIWVWGYDEMSWFAHQDKAYRKKWLRNAHDWIGKTDSNGFLQMPTRRKLAAPVDGIRMFAANRRSEQCKTGFDLEDTILDIWKVSKR